MGDIFITQQPQYSTSLLQAQVLHTTVLWEPALCKYSCAASAWNRDRSVIWGRKLFTRWLLVNNHQSQDLYVKKFTFRLLFPNSSAKYLGSTNKPWFWPHLSAAVVSVEKAARKTVNCKSKGHSSNSNKKTYWSHPDPGKLVVVHH